jgi:hypothetical protein
MKPADYAARYPAATFTLVADAVVRLGQSGLGGSETPVPVLDLQRIFHVSDPSAPLLP